MFIQKANKVHNNKYDYSLVEYKNNHTKVQIICPEHGNFLQNPNNHLNGNRCPMCFIPGFNVDKPAILYFIKDVNTELYKIGITNRSIHQRFKPLKENKDYLILDYWYYKKGIDAYKAERKILTYFKSDRVVNDEWDSRISGATEFFSSNIIQHKNFQKIQEIKKGYKIMARKIIAFIGRRGSGKDTTADLFAEWFKEENADALIASFAFAGTIKDIVHDTLSISTEQSEFLKRNPEIKIANGMDLREFYNHFGDVLKSRFGKRIFTEKTVEDITRTLSSVEPDLILVTDVRYPMEQAALKKLGEDQGLDVHFIKMVNTNLAGLPKEPGEHESESLSDDIFGDSTIVASSTQELSNKAQGIYNELYPTN
jgi:energy-coupling factor transporter ATP-binding protein EcfA2